MNIQFKTQMQKACICSCV